MKKHRKFPRIYLIFTDLLKRLRKYRKPIKKFILVYIGTMMLFLLGVSSYDLYNNYQSKKKIDLERQEIIGNIEKWQRIVEKYQDYRDGYFQLAILEYRLKDFTKSKYYLDKALALDPNLEKGRELEKILIPITHR